MSSGAGTHDRLTHASPLMWTQTTLESAIYRSKDPRCLRHAMALHHHEHSGQTFEEVSQYSSVCQQLDSEKTAHRYPITTNNQNEKEKGDVVVAALPFVNVPSCNGTDLPLGCGLWYQRMAETESLPPRAFQARRDIITIDDGDRCELSRAATSRVAAAEFRSRSQGPYVRYRDGS